MQLNIKVKKTSHYKKKIAALQKKLTQAHNKSIFIGYFNDQGEHIPSGLSYAGLMAIHEFGAPDVGIPARPVLNITQNYGMFSPEDKIAIRKAFQGVFVKNIPLKNAFDSVGQYYQQKGKSVFGSSLLLKTVEGNPPLIDTHDLSEAFSYRTSFTYTAS